MEEQLFKAASALGGFAGIACCALIFFIGKRLIGVEQALDRITRMELMRLIASPHVAPELKSELQSQLIEVEAAETRRKK